MQKDFRPQWQHIRRRDERSGQFPFPQERILPGDLPRAHLADTSVAVHRPLWLRQDFYSHRRLWQPHDILLLREVQLHHVGQSGEQAYDQDDQDGHD